MLTDYKLFQDPSSCKTTTLIQLHFLMLQQLLFHLRNCRYGIARSCFSAWKVHSMKFSDSTTLPAPFEISKPSLTIALFFSSKLNEPLPNGEMSLSHGRNGKNFIFPFGELLLVWLFSKASYRDFKCDDTDVIISQRKETAIPKQARASTQKLALFLCRTGSRWSSALSYCS